MKNRKTYIFGSVLIAFLFAMLFTGCGSGGFLLDKQSVVSTSPTGEQVTNTVYAPLPQLTQGIDTAKAANATLVPAPYNVPVEGGLAILSGLLATYVAYKNKSANATQAALDSIHSGLVGTGLVAPQLGQAIQTYAIDNNSVSHPAVQSIVASLNRNPQQPKSAT